MNQAELLARLKRRLSPTDSSRDDLLKDLLADAENTAKGYTGRACLPAALSGAVVELAAGAYNHLGLEGQSSHSEGGVSQSIDGLPKHIRDVLNMYRLGRVGGG